MGYSPNCCKLSDTTEQLTFLPLLYLFLAALGLHYFALVFSSCSELELLIAVDSFVAEPRILGCVGFSSCGVGLVASGNVETS